MKHKKIIWAVLVAAAIVLIVFGVLNGGARDVFAKAVKIKNHEAGKVLHILNYLNIIDRCGKEGRAYAYRVVE